MKEYIGYKDDTGEGLCNMGLTDEEIIRCRDCKHYIPEVMYEEYRAPGLYEPMWEPPSCRHWSFVSPRREARRLLRMGSKVMT